MKWVQEAFKRRKINQDNQQSSDEKAAAIKSESEKIEKRKQEFQLEYLQLVTQPIAEVMKEVKRAGITVIKKEGVIYSHSTAYDSVYEVGIKWIVSKIGRVEIFIREFDGVQGYSLSVHPHVRISQDVTNQEQHHIVDFIRGCASFYTSDIDGHSNQQLAKKVKELLIDYIEHAPN